MTTAHPPRHWILTSQAEPFDVEHPTIGGVRTMDLAWSLAQLNRFNGHCLRPYSAAEHSLLVCEIAEREHGLDVHGLLAALLHDAHKAYAGELHRPAQQVVGVAWQLWDSMHQSNVLAAFALITAHSRHWRSIRLADLQAQATAWRDLLPTVPTVAPELDGIAPVGWVRLHSPERTAMTWEDWRDRWLDRYHELDYARNEALFPSMPAA